MRKSIISFLLAIITTATMAQTNPKPGYVITNTGDTIRGVIDFRTNEKLSKQCQFWANGEKEGKVYLPGDIEGFRFDNNGKYFVRVVLMLRVLLSCTLLSLWFRVR